MNEMIIKGTIQFCDISAFIEFYISPSVKNMILPGTKGVRILDQLTECFNSQTQIFLSLISIDR